MATNPYYVIYSITKEYLDANLSFMSLAYFVRY